MANQDEMSCAPPLPSSNDEVELQFREPSLELLSLLKRGDSEAWRAFMAHFSPLIAHAARDFFKMKNRSCSIEALEDLLQEVYMRIASDDFRLLRLYEPAKSSFKTYILLIASSTIRNALRRPHIPARPLEEAQGIPAPPVIPPHALEDAKGSLTKQERRLFGLLFEEGKGLDEAADCLRLSRQTIHNCKSRILKKIRNFLRG